MAETLSEAKGKVSKTVAGNAVTVLPASPNAPWYIVGKGGFFLDRYYAAGERVQYAGKPGASLTPMAGAMPAKRRRNNE